MTTQANVVDLTSKQSELKATAKALYHAIAKLTKVENITKVLLGELSRSVLAYHLEGGHDIGIVNRLLAGLSPTNRKVAKQYLCYFLPHAFDEETYTFGKMFQKEDKRTNKYLAIGSFLDASPDNNIWTWAEEHITIEAKAPDYAKQVTSAVTKALKNGVAKDGVIGAMLAGGVTIGDLISALEAMETQAKSA